MTDEDAIAAFLADHYLELTDINGAFGKVKHPQEVARIIATIARGSVDPSDQSRILEGDVAAPIDQRGLVSGRPEPDPGYDPDDARRSRRPPELCWYCEQPRLAHCDHHRPPCCPKQCPFPRYPDSEDRVYRAYCPKPVAP